MSFTYATAYSQTLNETETKPVCNFLFGSEACNQITMNEQDKRKAGFLLNQLIEGSCKMSLVEGLYKGTVSIKATVSESVEQIVKSIVKSFHSNCSKAVAEGFFYESVRASIARNWKSSFEIRKQTGEW